MTAVAAKPLGHDVSGLRSVSISTRVIGCFTQHEEMGPTQVARELDIAKSTAYEMLTALVVGGLLERTPRGRYRLSLQLFDYGQLVLDRLPIRRVARPELMALHDSVQETVQLGLPAGGRVVYVERFDAGSLPCEASGEWMRKVSGFASRHSVRGRASTSIRTLRRRFRKVVISGSGIFTCISGTSKVKLKRVNESGRVIWVSASKKILPWYVLPYFKPLLGLKAMAERLFQ